LITIGVGEFAIYEDINESIITYALGSCIALIIWCPVSKKTAMAHIVLPKLNRVEQYNYLQTKPSYFADVIVPKLLNEFLGTKDCQKDKLQVLLAGGAISKNELDVFQVGERNTNMIKFLLSQYGIIPNKLEVGGTRSRTVEIKVINGEVQIKSQNMVI